MGKSDPACAEPFRRVILDTLSELTRAGFDHALLAELVDGHETDCRRASLSVHTGSQIMESFLRIHVQHDDVRMLDGLTRLRACMAEDECYFEHLVETYILNSCHWAMTRCIPSRTLSAERRERMLARFAAESARIAATPGAYDALCAHVEAFNAYLTAPDSPEVSVPHLTPADLSTDGERRDMEVGTVSVGDAPAVSLIYEATTDGMVQAGLLFELTGIPEEDLFYVACLKDAVLSLPTEAHALPELSDAWIRLHTNPGMDLRVESDSRAYLALTLDAPEEHLGEAVALLNEYIGSVVFDPAVLRHIFANASAMRTRLISGGHRTALRLATRTLSTAERYHDLFFGLDGYRRYADLADHFDERTDALTSGLTRVWHTLRTAVKPIAYLIGSADAARTWTQAIAALPLASAIPAEMPDRRPRPLPRRRLALTVPGEVNYCAEVYDLADAEAGYTPRLQVVNTHLYSVYFWDEIRAKGGAYGAHAAAFRQGILGFTSYRDPRVADTYAVFDRLPDWLETHIPTRDEVDALIVSTMGSTYCAPRSPMDLGHAALARYLVGLTAADRRADMEAVLATTPADFAAYASAVRRLHEGGRGVRAVVGNADIIRRSGLFSADDIIEL